MTGLWLCLALASAEDVPNALVPIREAVGVEPFGESVMDESIVEERTMAIAAGLRCPVCQGMSVADSTTEAAMSMKARIADLVREGYTDEQIVDYFVARYDTWILLAPPKDDNPLVYVGPAVVGALGLVFILVALRRRSAKATPPPASTDPYTERVLKELDE
ncbi:MAG TPA: cytochrome c-type biogenesis protein CcmH [Myxococcota bacterium]|nr:cytochrome c-type biogenesis protein CcmH [Myxococcota bacterium]